MALVGLNTGAGRTLPAKEACGRFHMTLCMLGCGNVIESQRDVLGCMGRGGKFSYSTATGTSAGLGGEGRSGVGVVCGSGALSDHLKESRRALLQS